MSGLQASVQYTRPKASSLCCRPRRGNWHGDSVAWTGSDAKLKAPLEAALSRQPPIQELSLPGQPRGIRHNGRPEK